MFHIVVSCRCQDIFELLYDIGLMKHNIINLIDTNGATFRLYPTKDTKIKTYAYVEDVARLMQYERLWV